MRILLWNIGVHEFLLPTGIQSKKRFSGVSHDDDESHLSMIVQKVIISRGFLSFAIVFKSWKPIVSRKRKKNPEIHPKTIPISLTLHASGETALVVSFGPVWGSSHATLCAPAASPATVECLYTAAAFTR